MKSPWIIVALLFSWPPVPAQTLLPPGTIIPVELDHTLNARKAHAGQTITAEIMQGIPGTQVHRRAHVIGHIVEVDAPPGGPAHMVLMFDAVKLHSSSIPVETNVRAIASPLEVLEAQIPEEGASRGITPEVATTQQIGGEQVYRGGGPVATGILAVGQPVPYGVVGLPRAGNGGACRGVVGENRQPQALWVFSTDACGLYGYSDLRIEHAGRSRPVGKIVLAATNGKLILRSGTGLLLRVGAPAANR